MERLFGEFFSEVQGSSFKTDAAILFLSQKIAVFYDPEVKIHLGTVRKAVQDLVFADDLDQRAVKVTVPKKLKLKSFRIS